MAIDEITYPDVHDFASSQKAFYPLSIPVSHWQLRHYLSHPEPDTLYYASANDVYSLNTKTRKRKHIAILPFEARCTASGHGFVCVGGEADGHFAVIRLGQNRRAHVDDAVALEYWQAERTPHAEHIKVERIGEHIVNSISIHKIHDEQAHLYDVVAVLTNNDCTVRIYSLTHGAEMTALKAGEALNHATISPDGQTLAAVGDTNTLYLYSRVMKKATPQVPLPQNRLTMGNVTWKKVAAHRLYVPSHHAQRGYFTSAWSPRGHLLAVGSEAGYVTVFGFERTDADQDDTEIELVRLATIPSSRPKLGTQQCPGAIRCMTFSPDPWDLLLWAEDQGRICIVDARTGFRTKQVIELDPKDEKLKRHEIEDLAAEPDMTLTSSYAVPPSAEDEAALYVAYHERGLRHDSEHGSTMRNRPYSRFPSQFADRPATSSAADPMGLTSHESQVLDALRTTRQREEERTDGGRPRSVNYTSSTTFDRDDMWRYSIHDYVRTGTTDREGSRYSNFPYLSRRIDQYSGGDVVPPITDPRHDYALPPLPSPHPLDGVQQRYRARRLLDNATRPTTAADGDPQVGLSGPRTRPQRNPGIIPINTPLAPMPDGTPAPTTQPSRIPVTSRRETPAAETDDEQGWRTIAEAMDASTMDLARGPLFESSRNESTEFLPPPGTILSAGDASNEPNASTSALLSSTDEHVRALTAQRDRLRNLQRHLASTTDLARTSGTIPRPQSLDANDGFTSRYELLRDVPREGAASNPGFEAGWELLRRRSMRRGIGGMGLLSGSEIAVRTAGLAISADGRTVWTATEEGIFEIALRLKERMTWPAVQLR